MSWNGGRKFHFVDSWNGDSPECGCRLKRSAYAVHDLVKFADLARDGSACKNCVRKLDIYGKMKDSFGRKWLDARTKESASANRAARKSAVQGEGEVKDE